MVRLCLSGRIHVLELGLYEGLGTRLEDILLLQCPLLEFEKGHETIEKLPESCK